MQPNEQEACKKLIRDLYNNTASPSQVALAFDIISGLPYSWALAAIKTHAKNHQYINLAGLHEAAISAFSKFNDRRRESPRLVDWIVQQAMKRDPSGYSTGEERPAIVMEHFFRSWEEVQASAAPEHGKQTVRTLIFNHAVEAFRQLMQTDDEAIANAEMCVGLQPGEKIIIPKVEGGNGLSAAIAMEVSAPAYAPT